MTILLPASARPRGIVAKSGLADKGPRFIVTEHRQHPRKSVQISVAFQTQGGARVEASCRDISLGGIFLETESPLPYGAVLTVFLGLPGLKQEAIVQATVRWTEKGKGMGVQFGVMGARETHALLQLIQAG